MGSQLSQVAAQPASPPMSQKTSQVAHVSKLQHNLTHGKLHQTFVMGCGKYVLHLRLMESRRRATCQQGESHRGRRRKYTEAQL